jgi:hypothetical protein
MAVFHKFEITEYGDSRFPGIGYVLPTFPIRSRYQTFSTGAAPPFPVTHQAIDLMEA